MKRQKNKVVDKLNKTGAVFLVCHLLFIALVQSFHLHPEQVKCEHFGTKHKEQHNFQAEKCKVCDYLIHKKGKEICTDTICVQVQLLPLLASTGGYLYAGTYEFIRQGFTNKGPPSHVIF
ncbi:hypothetical protein ABIE26_004152 [Pedobacter africanus]|uniref:Uncharacterized protein n=1 Tax=Pedobacter africanus TaxID=151894 RepID=A0ACC6L1R3_9SPHI|nr:hypothetical protein [Pedobacter africanus]MDR6785442.1 hypothetical protein [Pedobacter africanus]